MNENTPLIAVHIANGDNQQDETIAEEGVERIPLMMIMGRPVYVVTVNSILIGMANRSFHLPVKTEIRRTNDSGIRENHICEDHKMFREKSVVF
jgi:hypothetical protein